MLILVLVLVLALALVLVLVLVLEAVAAGVASNDVVLEATSDVAAVGGISGAS